MDDQAHHDPVSMKILLNGSISSDDDIREIASAVEILTRTDLDMAHCSEKLVNLNTLLMQLLASGHGLEAVLGNENASMECVVEALAFDLLYSILDSEVRELDSFMDIIQPLIVDARHKISACEHSRELVLVVEGKLHDSEELLQRSQDHVMDMKMQLAKLQITNLGVVQSKSGPYGNCEVPYIEVKMQKQAGDQRFILRMLERSLLRELDLEKKIAEIKQNEEDLNLKLRLTEQVSSYMEEAAEVVWGRFLEAENAEEILMGISKEMLSRLQIVQFSFSGSSKREEEAKSNLQALTEQLKVKETTIEKLNSRMVQLIADNSEVSALRDKVKSLDEKLRETEFQLNKANAANEASQERQREMDGIVESLKESIYEAERRAESAEAKVMQLTETNLELTEELGILKGSSDSNTDKVTLLEKQLRELQRQLQHARASSEASQEQQNMLYSAIWDMETLIDELKQKVSTAQTKTEKAEEQSVMLSKTNLELSKELEFLRARVASLETDLSQANVEKLATAKDINIKTSFIMDMVMQLALERERVQKQLYSLTEKNKILTKKLPRTKKDAYENLRNGGGSDHNGLPSPKLKSTGVIFTEASEEVATNPPSKSSQVEGLSKNVPACTTEACRTEGESTVSANNSPNLDLEVEDESMIKVGLPNQLCIYLAILIFLLSILATYMCNKNPAIPSVSYNQ